MSDLRGLFEAGLDVLKNNAVNNYIDENETLRAENHSLRKELQRVQDEKEELSRNQNPNLVMLVNELAGQNNNLIGQVNTLTNEINVLRMSGSRNNHSGNEYSRPDPPVESKTVSSDDVLRSMVYALYYLALLAASRMTESFKYSLLVANIAPLVCNLSSVLQIIRSVGNNDMLLAILVMLMLLALWNDGDFTIFAL